MAATTAPAPTTPTTPTTTTPTVLAGTDRGSTQQFQRDIQGAKARIDSMFGKDSEFAQILQQKLDLKGQEGQRAAGLGGGVSLDKMEKMLNALDELKKKGLSPEHIQAIFLAGFVKGGVEGVMQFIGDGSAEHLQKDGFEKMKQLLENDYKRSIRYVAEYTDYLQRDLRPLLDKIYDKPNVLDDWLKKIYQEDRPVLLDRTLSDEEMERLNQEGYATAVDQGRVTRGRSNPYTQVPAACDDFAFYDAEKRGVDRFSFTRIDSGVNGVPVSTGTAGVLKNAKVGTVIHMSYSGRAGENAGSGQGSHWAVYLGGGVIQDQWGTYTVAEFSKVYGNRILEAAFVHPNM